jgi:ribosomal protein L11 methyltransferase
VPLERAEEARADWIERFPEGFEERELATELQLAAYVEETPPDLDGICVEDVEPGWEDAWRAFHRPAVIDGLWIGPPWGSPPPDLVAVVIDPGRAFGTGAHATTRLCVQLLSELPGGSLLDIGCGSGVLAIAAAKLGFAPVIALDHDAAAVDATRRNAAANAVELDVRIADALGEPLPRAEGAVANIALEVVEAIASRLDVRALVTSGYLRSDRPHIAGFRHRTRRTAEEWAADAWERE